MNENVSTIKDPTVYIKPSEKLIRFLLDNSQSIIESTSDLPHNLKCVLENEGNLLKVSDMEWLNEFLKNRRKEKEVDLLKGKKLYDEIDRIIENKYSVFDFDGFLEEQNKKETYLHDLLKGCELVLPENEKIPRNPILADRIERLKKEQEEREYREMTKNVDMNKRHLPEDTISFQMKMMNRHLIAILQFLVSVGAGFAFGFIGLELVIEELNFGIRLLLGIAFALIIAVAEFYFLAKHLDQEGEELTVDKMKQATGNVKTEVKLHKD